MKESREKEVVLSGASVEPFRVLLQYIYTGQMSLVGLKVGGCLCVRDLISLYCFFLVVWVTIIPSLGADNHAVWVP